MLNATPKISIIIPCLDGLNYVEKLFDALNQQSFKDFEIIFINSHCSTVDETAQKVNLFTELDIKIFSTKALLPGDARNLGVSHATASLITFIDMRTIPHYDWLESSYNLMEKSGFDIVLGKFTCTTLNTLQEYVKAATFGNSPVNSLPGTLVTAETFQQVGNFLSEARAGEDEEWLGRVHGGNFSVGLMPRETLTYIGLPTTLLDLAKKWFSYSIKSAPINVAKSQKEAYFFLLFLFILYFFFNWNYLLTSNQWDQSPYFIPHINKIMWSIFLFIYVILRGLVIPIHKGVKKSFLFPLNWLMLSVVSMIIDFSKLPGRVMGYLYYLKSKFQN